MIQIYIGNDLLDVYEDENIRVNRSVQNIRDISKTFTDFTQSFSVPASVKNNKIFKHWYSAEVVGGFDHRIRVSARIDINYLNYIQGVMQLNRADKVNGKIEMYKIQFFGSGVQLSDKLGDDTILDLDLSAYEFEWNINLVYNGIRTGLFADDVIVPLISSTRNWSYNTNFTNDIRYDPVATSLGLDFDELRPSIRLLRIIEAIQKKYGITFTGSFLTQSHVEDLFVHGNRNKGPFESFSIPQEVTLTTVVGGGGVWNKTISVNVPPLGAGTWKVGVTVTVTADLGFEDANIDVILNNGTQDFIQSAKGSSTVSYTLEYDMAPVVEVLSIKFSADKEFQGQMVVNENTFVSINPPALSVHQNLNISSNSLVRFTNNSGFEGILPKMKVIDLLTSLIKMFNLVIVSNEENLYYLDTLDNWYASGKEIDITKYVDRLNYSIARPVVYNEINYSYDYTDDLVLNSGYTKLNGRTYGDLNNSFGFDGGIFEIESLFDNILFTRLSNVGAGDLTEILVSNLIDEDLNPIDTNPIIFYNSGLKDLDADERIGLKNTPNNVEVDKYHFCSQERIFVTSLLVRQSLNFGSEISTINLTETTSSLFNDYWSSYIGDLLSQNRRFYPSFKANIPPHIIPTINLNDTLIIGDQKFIINENKVNLTNGDVELQLLNKL